MVIGPSLILGVGESEEALRWRRGFHALPLLRLVARAGEHYHTGDLDMLRQTRGGSGAVGCAGEDHFFPVQPLAVAGEKLLPVPLWIFPVEIFHELIRALHQSVWLRDGHEAGLVCAGCGLKAQAGEMVVVALLAELVHFPEPLARVGYLDRVVAVGVEAVEKLL